MKKYLPMIFVPLSLWMGCSKQTTKTDENFTVQTNFTAGEPYEVKITEEQNGTVTTVLDTTVTGEFTYNYTAPDDKGSIEVLSSSAYSSEPVITASENGEPGTKIEKSPGINGDKNKEVISWSCCSCCWDGPG